MRSIIVCKKKKRRIKKMLSTHGVKVLKVYTTPAAIASVKERIEHHMSKSRQLADKGNIMASDRAFDRAKTLEGHLPWPKKKKRMVVKRVHPKYDYNPQNQYGVTICQRKGIGS